MMGSCNGHTCSFELAPRRTAASVVHNDVVNNLLNRLHEPDIEVFYLCHRLDPLVRVWEIRPKLNNKVHVQLDLLEILLLMPWKEYGNYTHLLSSLN